MELSTTLEAILYYRSAPVSIRELSQMLDRKDEEVQEALDHLEGHLTNRGIRLIRRGEEVLLSTAPEASDVLSRIKEGERSKELSRASLETLSVILYMGPLSKSEIEYIRGVSSSFILRSLLLRGLIEKRENPKDKRGYLYAPTFDLLGFLGISKVEDLPEYNTLRGEVTEKKKALENALSKEEHETA